MGRRNKSVLADALVNFLVKLPWWVGVVLAFLSYLVLHALATPSAPVRVGV